MKNLILLILFTQFLNNLNAQFNSNDTLFQNIEELIINDFDFLNLGRENNTQWVINKKREKLFKINYKDDLYIWSGRASAGSRVLYRKRDKLLDLIKKDILVRGLEIGIYEIQNKKLILKSYTTIIRNKNPYYDGEIISIEFVNEDQIFITLEKLGKYKFALVENIYEKPRVTFLKTKLIKDEK